MSIQFKVGVVGNGVMGKGIQKLFVSKEVNSTILDPRKVIKGENFDLDTYDIFIECVGEELDLKIEIFKKLEAINQGAIFASCTSSLSIIEMQNQIELKNQLIGIHFMNPPTFIRHIELIPTELTSLTTFNIIKKWLDSLDRVVTTVPDSPGFVVNALLFSLFNRAAKLMEETNITAFEIDNLLINVAGHNMGPLKTLDLIGIDTSYKILTNLFLRDPENNLCPAKILETMIEKGELGRKVKRGFYSY